MRSASAGPMSRPLMRMYEVLPGPTRFTRRRISLYPTSIPSFATGTPNLPLSALIRRSAAVESSHPPPTQKPFMRQMVGFDTPSRASMAPSNAAA